MKNECDIIKDLLFGYNDNTLTNTSKEFVENHLKQCESCKKLLEEIKKENIEVNEKEENNQIKEINILKNIKKKISNKNKIILITSIVLVSILLFNIQVFKTYKEIASTMEIYLEEDITNEQIEEIKHKIISNCENLELEYVSKEKALEKLRNKLGIEKEYLIEGWEEENPMHAQINIKTDTEINKVVDLIKDMPKIKTIATHEGNPYLIYISETFSKIINKK